MYRAEFDEIATIYDSTIPDYVLNHYITKRTNFIQSILKKGLVLDIGCGTGALDSRLHNNGLNVISADISRKMLRQAQRHYNLRCVCTNASALPFKSGIFDLAISIVVLHHISDKNEIFCSIREMLRTTKSNGIILIWDHNPLNPYWFFFMRRLPQDKKVKRLVSLKEIVKNLRDNGAEKITVRRLGFIPDFIPEFLLGPFEFLEKIVEIIPLLNKLCAHNVIVAYKGEGCVEQ